MFVGIIERYAAPEQQRAVWKKMRRCFALCAFHETGKESSLDDCRGNLNSIFYSVKTECVRSEIIFLFFIFISYTYTNEL